MSWPDAPAFRMRYAAAASPPNPPPTICAFIGLLPQGSRFGTFSRPERALSKQRIVSLTKTQTVSRGRLPRRRRAARARRRSSRARENGAENARSARRQRRARGRCPLRQSARPRDHRVRRALAVCLVRRVRLGHGAEAGRTGGLASRSVSGGQPRVRALVQRREGCRDDQHVLLLQGSAGLPAARRPDAFVTGTFADRKALGGILVGPDVAPAVEPAELGVPGEGQG